MRNPMGAVAMFLLSAGVSQAAAAPLAWPPGLDVIQSPQWSVVPTEKQFKDNYPDRARRLGKGGQVSLACQVEVEGKLRCVVAAEDPERLGFGESALLSSTIYRIKELDGDGKPVLGRFVQIDIPYKRWPL